MVAHVIGWGGLVALVCSSGVLVVSDYRASWVVWAVFAAAVVEVMIGLYAVRLVGRESNERGGVLELDTPAARDALSAEAPRARGERRAR